MHDSKLLGRRLFIGALAAGLVAPKLSFQSAFADEVKKPKGQLKQSVAKWCFFKSKWSIDELCKKMKPIGYDGIDLVSPKDWPTLKKYGLTATIIEADGIVNIGNGLNRIENHAKIVAQLKNNIDLAAEAGVPNVICFSGNRKGMSDEEGLKNCIIGAKLIAPYAEKKGVTICLEVLNSKVDHKDYMADRSDFGFKLAKAVGSPRFKILFDIYHMQVMEGNIIQTLNQNIDYIGHIHTAGVPGRNEIDDTQELNYKGIAAALIKLNYKGFIGHEFIPNQDPIQSFKKAYDIFNVG